MPRRLGVIVLIVFLLAGCGSNQTDKPARRDYAVDVGSPEAMLPLPPPTPQSSPSPAVAPLTQVKVAVPLLNVRAGPNAEAELLGQVKQGDMLPILERNDTGDWLRVQLPDGQAGWVAGQYVSLETAAAQGEVPVVAPPLPPAFLPTGAVAAQLIDVVDGRTIRVSLAGAAQDLRLIGVDTPERGQPGYAAARRATSNLLTPTLYLVADQTDHDAGGRLLRYVFNDAGLMVNSELIRQGWAQPVEDPPDTARASEFRVLAGEAAASGRGFWGGAGADGAPVYALTQGNTNIREGPGTDFEVSSTEADGTPLLVLGRTRDGEWLQVRAPDRSSGWVSTRLVALAVEADSAPVVGASNQDGE